MTGHAKRIACIVFAIISSFPAAAAPQELSADQGLKLNRLFQRGRDQYQNREHEKAVETYRDLLSQVPGGAAFDVYRMQAHYLTAVNLALLGRGDEAVSQLERSIDHGLTDPRHLDQEKDFDRLRGSPGFLALPARMKARAGEEERRSRERLRALDFSLQTVDGKTVARKDSHGKVLVLNIWGTWCPPCMAEIPAFVELHRRHAEKGLSIVGLTWEKVQDPKEAAWRVQRVVKDFKVPYPCALVPKDLLQSIPNLSGFPTTIIYGRDGVPRAVEVGARDLRTLEALVQPLLAEKEPAASSSLAPEPVASTQVAGGYFKVGDFYLAGQPTAEGFREAKQKGVRTVINLRIPAENPGFDEPALMKELGLEYIAIPLTPQTIEASQADEFLAALGAAPKPVLIHCATGNRVSGLWAIHLAVNHGLPVEEALEAAGKSGLRSPELKEFSRRYLETRSERSK